MFARTDTFSTFHGPGSLALDVRGPVDVPASGLDVSLLGPFMKVGRQRSTGDPPHGRWVVHELVRRVSTSCRQEVPSPSTWRCASAGEQDCGLVCCTTVGWGLPAPAAEDKDIPVTLVRRPEFWFSLFLQGPVDDSVRLRLVPRAPSTNKNTS